MTTTPSPRPTATIDTAPDDDPKVASVQRLYAAFGRGDLDGVLAELAEDVDWAAEAAGTGAPWYGSYRGRDAVPGFFAAIASTVDIDYLDVVGCTCGGDDVIATVRWAYTVKATGRRAEMYMQHWWRFADGRIVFFRGSEDSAQSVAAFAPSLVEIVRDGYDAFSRGDIPAVLATFADTAQWYSPDELPTGGTFRGPAEIAAFFSALPAHYDELQVHPERFHAAGDRVVVEGHHTGRVAGAPFDVGFVHVWTMQDRSVVEFREYMDSGKLLPLFGPR
ncbi:nuclear transport factor 2 family protein [Actinomycetospora endophytica]|uniref:Nuclear transport factor 2 family protein n=1 Tax=Actinomycetospora endophytica TaxID=2291215 RepID=A0ABS8P1S1_9PSEU|nr:nuclear transport factor 2 family protein [Actinomycetospora endophytica]MCD2192013.1 nuclear transport factor 2 family protein [Actinomycetospora endophytica]